MLRRTLRREPGGFPEARGRVGAGTGLRRGGGERRGNLAAKPSPRKLIRSLRPVLASAGVRMQPACPPCALSLSPIDRRAQKEKGPGARPAGAKQSAALAIFLPRGEKSRASRKNGSSLGFKLLPRLWSWVSPPARSVSRGRRGQEATKEEKALTRAPGTSAVVLCALRRPAPPAGFPLSLNGLLQPVLRWLLRTFGIPARRPQPVASKGLFPLSRTPSARSGQGQPGFLRAALPVSASVLFRARQESGAPGSSR